MTVSSDQIAEILDRMKRGGVAGLEASGPGWSLQLGRLGEPPVQAQQTTPVTSPCVGTVIRQHPLADRPMTVDGQFVAAGDVLAIVAAGLLYRAVIAPVAGQVVHCHVEQRRLVEYGTPLFQIAPALNQGDEHAN